MKFNVGDLVTWDGHDAKIAAIMEHPSRYIIEYTVRQSDVSGTIAHSYNRTKNVKEEEVMSVDDDLDILDDTRFKSYPKARYRFRTLTLGVDEIGRDGEVLSSKDNFEGMKTAEDVIGLLASKDAEIAALKASQMHPEIVHTARIVRGYLNAETKGDLYASMMTAHQLIKGIEALLGLIEAQTEVQS
jgi:hypothetical protein